jgi:multicomponent Na+:H+ antiporter subunit G
MNWMEGLATILLCLGALFFLAGTVGLLRFPDALSRLHALTKADNLGLGFIVAALVLQSPSVAQALKLVLIWLLALLASTTVCYLVAREVAAAGEREGHAK